jgi:hypothetical protein
MYAGRIDQHNLATVFSFALGNMHYTLDAAARRLRLRRYDRKFLADEGIEQRGFSSVGPAKDADESRTKWHGISFQPLAFS